MDRRRRDRHAAWLSRSIAKPESTYPETTAFKSTRPSGSGDIEQNSTGHSYSGFALSAQVQTVLQQQPFSGHVFFSRGRRGDTIKLLWYDGDGLCLFAKRLERGRFIWPQASEGAVSLTRAQLSMLMEGIDWRRPEGTWTPQVAV
jgi:transposase